MHGVDTGSAGRSILEMVWLELTTRCNLHCLHCYADAGVAAPLQGRMSLDDWLAAIDEALDLGAGAIQFIGGEPTLHPHFRRLLDHVGKAKVGLVEVYTNATRLTDEIVGCLKDNGARVAASFYAAEPGVHDAITMRAGSWRRTVAGIERALTAGLPVRIGIIETAESEAHVPEAIAFLRRLGIREIGVDRERGIGRGRRQAADTAGEDFSQLCGRCGKARLCVTATGDVFPCVFSRRTSLGQARGGLRSALASVALAGFRASVELEQRSRIKLQGGRPFCQPGPSCAPSTAGPCLPDQPQPCCPDIKPCRPWDNRWGLTLRARPDVKS
jgi:MoaA/NifB/PqqE/SkfB family radical SAM enzyme